MSNNIGLAMAKPADALRLCHPTLINELPVGLDVSSANTVIRQCCETEKYFCRDRCRITPLVKLAANPTYELS
jgi:hypothetical protein